LIGALEYAGSKGVNLYSINTMNIPGSALVYGAPGSGSGSTADRINTQYSGLNLRTNGGFSQYHALNARLEMRNFKREGLTLRFNYTWSHAIDNISNTFSETVTGAGNLGVLDPLNPNLDKGSADFDVRHRVTLAAVWEVPYKGNNAIGKQVLGGWSLVPNFVARTGVPFSLWDCTNSEGFLCPRAMYDQPLHPTYTQTSTGSPNEFNYLNIGVPDTSYANSRVGVSDFGPFPARMTGRNAFNAPGWWNADFAVHKTFALSERMRLQFRAEAFNVFNHSNLYVVGSATDVSAATSGFVTAIRGVRADNNAYSFVAKDNRNLQLALKLLF
jgi:hypothetical protein